MVEVLDRKTLASGQVRLRVDRGWTRCTAQSLMSMHTCTPAVHCIGRPRIQ